MTQCLGLQFQDSRAAASWVTCTPLACSSLLGFFVLKRFTKQMDIFMAQRLSGSLHAMMSAGLPNSPLQIAGWIILRKHPYGFPCPALHTHCWPLPEKKGWTEWTSGLTLNMEGESFVFIPACSWGMPVSRLLWLL